MPTTFTVTVAKEYLTFSAAHFITIAGHQCERLHGHNYRVGVAVSGAVDRASGFVVDFGVIKQVVKPLVEAVDHRVLLPTRNDAVVWREVDDRVEVTYRGRAWFTFPRRDVALVPVSDTTAELLAEYFAVEIARALAAEAAGLAELVVEVEESVGQSASVRLALGGAA